MNVLKGYSSTIDARGLCLLRFETMELIRRAKQEEREKIAAGMLQALSNHIYRKNLLNYLLNNAAEIVRYDYVITVTTALIDRRERSDWDPNAALIIAKETSMERTPNHSYSASNSLLGIEGEQELFERMLYYFHENPYDENLSLSIPLSFQDGLGNNQVRIVEQEYEHLYDEMYEFEIVYEVYLELYPVFARLRNFLIENRGVLVDKLRETY